MNFRTTIAAAALLLQASCGGGGADPTGTLKLSGHWHGQTVSYDGPVGPDKSERQIPQKHYQFQNISRPFWTIPDLWPQGPTGLEKRFNASAHIENEMDFGLGAGELWVDVNGGDHSLGDKVTITRISFTGNSAHPLKYEGQAKATLTDTKNATDTQDSALEIDLTFAIHNACEGKSNAQFGCGSTTQNDAVHLTAGTLSGDLVNKCPAEVAKKFADGTAWTYDGSKLTLGGGTAIPCLKRGERGILCGATAKVQADGCEWTVDAFGAPSVEPRTANGNAFANYPFDVHVFASSDACNGARKECKLSITLGK